MSGWRTYLQWVGTGHYPTIDDFVEEAREHGILKRLPNLGVARELAKPRTAVFLVHDRGVVRGCPACAVLRPCPTCAGDGSDCQRCKGLGSIEVSTGGHVEVDGARSDYLWWLRLRKNPKHSFWNREHTVVGIKPCGACGGRGKIPLGSVFGVYLPSVLAVGDRVRLVGDRIGRVPLEQAEAWPRRPWGKPGAGLYSFAIAHGSMSSAAFEFREAYYEALGGVDFTGDLGVFAEPIAYRAKQFRGLKRWTPPVLEEES